MSQLGSDAAQEEACQAVAIDDWQAGRCQPTNEAKANDREVLPQPIPVEAGDAGNAERLVNLNGTGNESRGQLDLRGSPVSEES